MSSKTVRQRKLPLRMKLLFSVLATAAAFVLAELVLAAAGVRPVLYSEDPYVGFVSRIPLFVEETNSNGRTHLVTADNKLRFFNPQRFAADKPSGTYRIFCLGGSTTYGRPYNDTTSFCGWLREFLSEADPSREWELINAGGISYASYRVAALTEELIRYEPDLFVVYSGQNEFLERRTYHGLITTPPVVLALGAVLNRTRTYAAIKHGLDTLAGRTNQTRVKPYMLPGEVEAVLDTTIGPKDYHRNEEFQKQVIDHYRHNLARLIDIARSVGAKVVLVTPASNLLHCSPFKSEHRRGLGDADLARWQALYDRAAAAYAVNKWGEALAALDRALAIDDRYAHLHYLRGRVLYELKKYGDAKAALQRARDEDICPLRALGPMQKIVAEVAADRNVPLIDFASLVESRSDHGIPGENLFLDHVHPTIAGNRMLALAILHEMVRRDIVNPARGWDDAAIARVTHRVESNLDRRSHGSALRNLSKVLVWAGKYEEARKLAERAAEMIPGDAVARFQLGLCAQGKGDWDQAVKFYRQAIEIEPDYAIAHTNLGSVLEQRGDVDLAMEHFGRAIAINTSDYKAIFHSAQLLLKQGNFRLAAERFQRVIEMRPLDAEVHAQLAAALVRLQRIPEAVSHIDKAIELRPDDPDMHNTRGSLQAAQGDYREVERSYRRALELDAEHTGTRIP